MKKFLLIYIVLLLILVGYSYYYFKKISLKDETIESEVIIENNEDTFINDDNSLLKDTSDINLHNTDGVAYYYSFNYDGRDFVVIREIESWRIIDSYLINNAHDMQIICQALLDIQAIPSKDYLSTRNAEDMVYEWQIHNFVYDVLPESNEFKYRVKDVDFDPADQGKTLEEFFKEATGIDYSKIFSG